MSRIRTILALLLGVTAISTFVSTSRQWVNDQIAAGHTTAPFASTDCMLHGLPGTRACMTFGSLYAGTLVANETVGIVAFAAHHPLHVGFDTEVDGQLYTVTAVKNLPGTDIGFGKLNAKVVGVDPIPLFPTVSDKVKTGVGIPCFWYITAGNKFKINLRSIGALHLSDTVTPNAVYSPLDGDASWRIGNQLVVGDSSSPLVTVVNGELALLGCATSTYSCGDLYDYRTESEALWLSEFGVADTFTVADLSAFDDVPDAEAPPAMPPAEPLTLDGPSQSENTMAFPIIVTFVGNATGSGVFTLYFAKTSSTTYALMSGSTAGGGGVGAGILIINGTDLSKSGGTWTLTVTDGDTANATYTIAASADGGFSTTAGSWGHTGGTLTSITETIPGSAVLPAYGGYLAQSIFYVPFF